MQGRGERDTYLLDLLLNVFHDVSQANLFEELAL
jgi:hypothetical protein